MGKTAFVLGGSGFVGRHIARRLADTGWDVTVGSRGETPMSSEIAGLTRVSLDRTQAFALANALGDGVDVLVDVIPYEIRDAEQIVSLNGLVGSVVAISTASVYADDQGRTLDEATSGDDFPKMPVPISETQPRAAAGNDTYSTKKVGIEDVLLQQDDISASVIRPCAIYGPGATHCREWFFVRRVLDHRPRVLLGYEGKSVFHTTGVDNLAELVRLTAEKPGTRVLNCGDPDPPSVRAIAAVIANALGHGWEEILVPTALSGQSFLENPWGVPAPWILDLSKAHRELGYVPVTSYEDAVVDAVESIVKMVSEKGTEALSDAIPYLPNAFDYEAEDEFWRHLA